MTYTEQRGYRRPRRRAAGKLPLVPLTLIVAIALAAAGYVGYVLWPRWPGDAVAPDAPPLPITVAGVTFNVPPGAIRVPLQRRAGAQERIDLMFLWPTLKPPPSAEKPAAPATPDAAAAKPTDRIVLTIAAADGALTPAERFKTIYPRYLVAGTKKVPGGLVVAAFRDDTPYRGEELIYDSAAPKNFLARCTEDKGLIRGTCLAERRIGAANITVRFPRDWLNDWRSVKEGIDKLIANLRPLSG
jgi:hypothetical protein